MSNCRSSCRSPLEIDSVGNLCNLGNASGQVIVQRNLKFVYWNVQGWSNCDKGAVEQGVRTNDIRAQAISVLQPDVIAMTETWLQNDESLSSSSSSSFNNGKISYAGGSLIYIGL